MRITGEQSESASRLGSIQGVNAPTSTVSSTSADSSAAETPAATVTFSSRAQEIGKAKAAVDATPEVRQDLVNSIKSKIDSGTYNVSSSDIADMMLRRHAADNAQ